MSEETKALFPEGVETLTISKDDYDRLYGQLTYENIILQQKVEQLENIRKEAIDKLYCWGEVLDAEFQKSMLNILNKGSEDNEDN